MRASTGKTAKGFLAAALLAGLVASPPLGRAAEVLTPPVIPDLFDPDNHPSKPDPNAVKSIRFLTTDDFPPFHFALPDGTLAGLDIDLARAICTDLKIACTIQARRFDGLVAQVKAGADDAIVASLANTPVTRANLDFTAPYYTTPARFVVPTGGKLTSARPEALAGHRLGVQADTAQEAYLRAFFAKAAIKSYPDQQALRAGLRVGEVEAIFADGITMALWLNGTDAGGCCTFLDGPFTESRYFGNGVSIAVGRGNIALRETLDYELVKLTRSGAFADLYLKYFPIGFY